MLPVSAERTPGAVRAAIAETAPSLMLLLGVAPGRAGLSIERTAVNLLDFPSPDNDGASPWTCRSRRTRRSLFRDAAAAADRRGLAGRGDPRLRL